MRNPFRTAEPSDPSDSTDWLKYVCSSHLDWLMDFTDRVQRGEELADEDTFQITAICEQSERFMAQAEAEGWDDDLRRERMVDTWWEKNRAT